MEDKSRWQRSFRRCKIERLNFIVYIIIIIIILKRNEKFQHPRKENILSKSSQRNKIFEKKVNKNVQKKSRIHFPFFTKRKRKKDPPILSRKVFHGKKRHSRKFIRPDAIWPRVEIDLFVKLVCIPGWRSNIAWTCERATFYIYIYICIEIRDRIRRRRKKRKGKGSRHSFLRRFSFINLINTANRGYGLWIEVTRQSRKSYWMEKTIACHCVASAPSLANRYAFAYRRPFARRGNPRKRTVIHLQPWNCCGEKVYYRRIILLSWNFNR